jgi:predicted TIM-barrel fold metal-dependent hydrolase
MTDGTGHAAIISVDGHARASRATYRGYIDPVHRDAFDDWRRAAEAVSSRDAGNLHSDLGDDAQWDTGRRFADLERHGVVAEVLFPNGLPFQTSPFDDAGRASDPALTRAAMVAHNRWLADLCSQAPERLRGQALVSFDDIDRAVADVHWAKDHGLGGIMMPGLQPGGTLFFDPALDPVWAAIEETGLPISQHGGSGTPKYTPAGMAAILTLAYEHAFFSGRSLWQMIVGGVFDRFPDLTVVYVETEVYWIGPALQHFDARLHNGDDWTDFARFLERSRAFGRLPSEYWATNCYAGISPFHPAQLPLDKLGSGYDPEPGEFAMRSDRAMFGVDYPHFESIYQSVGDQVAALHGQPSMTETDTRKVLFDNAAEVYGFDAAALAPHVDRVGFELPVTAA